jgi:hypothetical protein
MTKTTFLLGALLVTITVLLTNCSKTNSNPSSQNESQLQAAVMQNTADEYRMQTDEELLSADISTAVGANPSFTIASASTADSSLIAGAIVDNSIITASLKKIKIVYTGTSVFGTIHTGTIIIELVKGDSWIEAGAVLKIDFEDVKITYMERSVTYNGTSYITNVSGGLPYWLGDSVIHRVRVNASVTFDDNSKITWWAARKNLYVKTNASFASYGDTLINGETYAMGGVNRYNTYFLIKAPQPVVANLTCGFNKPVSGLRIFTGDNRNVTITFGVSENGSLVGEGNCAYGYKVEWPKWNGEIGTAIISY